MSEERVTERKGVEPGQIVMPFYLICDVSGSMTGDMPALNEGVRKLHRSISASPVVDDVAQLSLLTFSDSARVVMPMGQLSGLTIPQLRADGGTNYGAAFRELALVIVQDNAKLKGQGYKVYRPCAFFLTDGEPLDSDWHRTFSQTLTYDPKALTGMKDHPIFVPFGFRDAPDSVLRQLAYPPEKGKWYHTRSMAIDQVLSNILDVIMNTVVTSANSVGAGRPAVVQQPPAPGSALTQGDSEYDPDFV